LAALAEVRATFARVSEEPVEALSESPSPMETTKGPSARQRIGLASGVAVAVIAGVIVFVFADRIGSGSTPTTSAAPIAPVALNASGLRKIGVLARQPIYWAGPKEHYLYELKRTADGSVYIRYLPPGVNAGAPGNNYLIIATHPFKGALDALEKVANGRGISVPDGGLALVDGRTAKSVLVVFPKVDYQIEVFDPSPKKALEIATSGQLRSATTF
jgi:hypothetical protein